MNLFLKKLFLFSIPLFIGWVILFAMPYNKKFAYSTIQKHCRNANWIYHRMFQAEAPIDVALIGSSRTMCDISDNWLQDQLSDSPGGEWRVANLGFCRLGRNFHFSLIKDLLGVRKPKLIILEVREQENATGHLDFPHIADAGDVLFPPLWVNKSYLKDIATATEMRLFPLREKWMGISRWTDSADVLRPHSYLYMDTLDICSEAAQAHPPFPLKQVPASGPKRWAYNFNQAYSRTYLKKIAKLTAEYQVPLVFFYFWVNTVCIPTNSH